MVDTITGKKEKILVIVSEASFGERIVSALDSSGYTAILVKNGADAMKSIIDSLPHLVILDIVVPGADSYEILEKKKAEPLLAKLPVFLMSTQGIPINMRRVPQGSVTDFIVTFKADPQEIVDHVNRLFGHEATNIPSPDNTPKKKLVWVEDDKLIGTILAKKLISSGFDLFHAKNGKEALEALKNTVPDVIALDLILPEMSGFDILQQIKQDEALKKVPVIILSNLGKPSDIEKAHILGANKFLVKAATSLDQIVAEIRELCK